MVNPDWDESADESADDLPKLVDQEDSFNDSATVQDARQVHSMRLPNRQFIFSGHIWTLIW